MKTEPAETPETVPPAINDGLPNRLYDAYFAPKNWEASGHAVPQWEGADEPTKLAWRHVAEAVNSTPPKLERDAKVAKIEPETLPDEPLRGDFGEVRY